MFKKAILFFIVLLVFSAVSAVPFTTLGGIKNPHAYILPGNMFQISTVSHFESTYHSENDPADSEMNYAVVLNYGLFDRAEIGGVYTKDLMFANMKYRLVQESELLPAISLGMDNMFSKMEDFNDMTDEEEKKFWDDNDDLTEIIDPGDYISFSYYLVVSKSSIMRGLPFIPYLESKFHFGFGQRRFKGSAELTKNCQGFVGVDLIPVNNFEVLFEFDGLNVNTGFGYTYRNLKFRAGIYRMEEAMNDDRDMMFSFNLMYTFDNFSTLKYESNTGSTSSRRVLSSGRRIMSSDDFIENENPLENELQDLREKRQQTAKELEEIKKLLEEE